MPALTRLQAQTLIGDLINDPSNTQWSTSQLQAQIQVSMEQFVEDTKALTDTQSFSIVSGTNTYALLADTLDILRVSLNGLPKLRMSKFDLDVKTSVNWAATAGTPNQYFVDFTSTNKNLTLYPIPQGSDVGTNNLVVEYIKVPPVLTADSDLLLNSQVLLNSYLMAIPYHAAAFFLESTNDPKNWANAKIYRNNYENYVSDCKETLVSLRQTETRRMRGGRYFKDA